MVWGAFIGHWHGHGSGKVKEFVMVGVWEGFGSSLASLGALLSFFFSFLLLYLTFNILQ